ncbi:hypothetical protein SAMN04487928_1247 [Butyrivibrio proteoclasticus]|uniref:Uncharacterized protein n=1 Tax=Butyrivibrio proteoclasticus TaxID=43305 RepID=A0A1I5WND6_9FIRM|nr:hypothetical protein [Butyrivibrio proteoclasticus]SFQ21323.1 hypothetical protein SAMN04487928_1247 [Butyrivibrio proteoclasticus]
MKKEINNLITNISCYVQSLYTDYIHTSNEAEGAKAVYRRNICLYNFMLKMQADLFQAMKGKNYSRLSPISDPSQIRIADYVQKDGTYLYKFSLSKKSSDDEIIDVILDKISANINADIKQAAFSLYTSCGSDMQFYYPYLANGLYVLKLIDNGTDIIMICATHLQP